MVRRASRTAAVLAATLLFALAGCRHTPEEVPAAHHASDTLLQRSLVLDSARGRIGTLRWPDFSDYKPAVVSFYEQRKWNPAWVDGHAATDQAIALTQIFAVSGEKGLNPEDYDASLWPARLGKLATANGYQLAEFDVSMTVAAMRYVSDLHVGRVNPQHFSFGIDIAAKKYDLAQFLVRQIVASGDVRAALAPVEPYTPEYRRTLDALRRYQGFTVDARDAKPLLAPGISLPPGAVYSDAHALETRLALLGDLPEDTPEQPGYTKTLADAVRRFQRRHNLTNDGRLSPATVAALNVPLSTRVSQLTDTLERLRWLPAEYGEAPLSVNIPEYTLRAYEEDRSEAFEMRVVVGKADEEDHQTPLLVQKMRYVVFRPFWNLTPTIVKAEIVPKVEANRDYLASRNFEVVDRRGKPVENWTAQGLFKDMYMVREKPGPTNSLGLVKFMLPNKLNIYLHSTPALQYFQRTRRDFSHGCIRLQEPEKLAQWVLRDQPSWTPEAIHDAMENGEDNKTVVLKHPIPVRIFYETARVDEDGIVHFFQDIYGYDREMEQVLQKGDPCPVKPRPKQQAADTE